jgi:Kef-type K+ transport system membrane component KefB
MVLLAAAIYAGLAVFIHWNLLSAVADGNGTAQPGILELLVPALLDGAVYLAIASAIYLVKRLFVRAKPRQLSNID